MATGKSDQTLLVSQVTALSVFCAASLVIVQAVPAEAAPNKTKVASLGAPIGLAPPPLFTGGKDFGDCLVQAHNFYYSGAYQQALQAFAQALNFKVDDPVALCGLGMCEAQIGAREGALEHLMRALLLKPDLTLARFHFACLVMHDGRYDEAASDFLRVLQAEPDNLAARGNLALCYMQYGQLDQALQNLLYIASKDPNSAETHYNLACVYETKKDLDNAAIEYKKTIELNEKHGLAFLGLSKIFMEKKDLKHALTMAKQACQLQPDNHYAYITMGRVLELGSGNATGKVKEDIERDANICYRQAIQLAPKDPLCKKLETNMLKETAKKYNLQDKLPWLK